MAEAPVEQWRGVDEGWGRRAAEFAALAEPGNCREYVALHQHLGVGAGVRLLDVACGSGLALGLAAARGATCAGLDASHRLIAVARDRAPEADLRVGDMHALPWEDDSFDVVTSFRGIWGTTPDALAEVQRSAAARWPDRADRLGPHQGFGGGLVLKPFTLATEEKVANQAAMVSLGRPGAGEELLRRWGFEDVQRVEIPFAWEFADPETYARTRAASGPGVRGDPERRRRGVRPVRHRPAPQVRDGLPLRAEIKVVGYLARKPVSRGVASGVEFLPDPEPGPAVGTSSMPRTSKSSAT